MLLDVSKGIISIKCLDNSKGVDLTDISEIIPLKAALDTWFIDHLLKKNVWKRGRIFIPLFQSLKL